MVVGSIKESGSPAYVYVAVLGPLALSRHWMLVTTRKVRLPTRLRNFDYSLQEGKTSNSHLRGSPSSDGEPNPLNNIKQHGSC